MTVIILAPRSLSPEALHDIRLVLIILCISILRGIIPGDLSVEGIATSFQHHTSTLEILTCTILLLILALRVCAYFLFYIFYLNILDDILNSLFLLIHLLNRIKHLQYLRIVRPYDSCHFRLNLQQLSFYCWATINSSL